MDERVPVTIDRLQVLWIDESRRGRHPVGELRRENGRFLFEYGDIAEAVASGFAPLPEFREIGRKYASDRLFATFAERIPSTRRSDRVRILRSLNLIDSADDFEILARSGGALATDRVEVVETRSVGDDFKRPLAFPIAGTRHHPLKTPLVPNEQLAVVSVSTNPYDTNACELRRSTGELAGFVPRAFSEAVAHALGGGIPLQVAVLRSIRDPKSEEPRWIGLLAATASSGIRP